MTSRFMVQVEEANALRAEVARLTADLERVTKERDEAKRRVEWLGLNASLPEKMSIGLRMDLHAMRAALRLCVEAVKAQRDRRPNASSHVLLALDQAVREALAAAEGVLR